MLLLRSDTAAFALCSVALVRVRITPRAEEMIVDQSHLCLHHHLSNIRLVLQFLSER